MPAIKIGVIWSGIEALHMVDHNIKNTIAINMFFGYLPLATEKRAIILQKQSLSAFLRKTVLLWLM